MNQKISNQFFLALGISLTLIACNQSDKKGEESTKTDSTVNTTTETAITPAKEPEVDAVKVAPDLYKVLKDTMGIRVLEALYKPGDSSAMHSHPDNAIYVISGGKTEFTEKDGKKNVIELKTGASFVGADEFHSGKNIGKSITKVLIVEVNRPRQIISQDAAMDAVKVAPGLYKLKSDSLGIRVLEATYKPGQSSALHAHPDLALYAIAGGTAEFTEKDGTKRSNELKTGMSNIVPADVHSVKNTGKTTMKILLVEVNRPIK